MHLRPKSLGEPILGFAVVSQPMLQTRMVNPSGREGVAPICPESLCHLCRLCDNLAVPVHDRSDRGTSTRSEAFELGHDLVATSASHLPIQLRKVPVQLLDILSQLLPGEIDITVPCHVANASPA